MLGLCDAALSRPPKVKLGEGALLSAPPLAFDPDDRAKGWVFLCSGCFRMSLRSLMKGPGDKYDDVETGLPLAEVAVDPLSPLPGRVGDISAIGGIQFVCRLDMLGCSELRLRLEGRPVTLRAAP